MVDIVTIPQRIKQLVSKPQRHNILHGFLPQIVVDAEHRLFREHRVNNLIQLFCGLLIPAKRLLHNHPPPRRRRNLGHAGTLQLMAHVRKIGGRNRQVKRPVPGGTTSLIQLGQGGGKLIEGGIVIKIAAHKHHALSQPLPHIIPEWSAGPSLDCLLNIVLKIGLGPVTTSITHQGETCRQQSTVSEIINCGQKFLPGQVAGDAENNHATRAGNPGETFILGAAQGIHPRCYW